MPSLYKEEVGPGSFVIDRTGHKLFSAALGASVGVALYDEVAGVGGLIHFLLPEPVGRSGSWHPEKYASAGLPFFIDRLLDAGASRERLKASVAGGTLFGRTDQEALHRNIGGRSAEVALAILQQQGIPVMQSETGGLLPLGLQLQTDTWQAAIAPLFVADNNGSGSLEHKPSAAEIDGVIERIKPIPQVALKVIRIFEKEEYSISEVATEVRRDQVIAARILRYANSVMVGPGRALESIDRALVFLGEKGMLEAVLSAAVEQFFGDHEGGYALMRGGLYRHALGVAHAARELARFTGWVEPAAAYTAGLLHDIGKIVLDAFVAETRPLFYRSTPDRHADYIALERELFGNDHQKTGQRLARSWNLPLPLVESIGCHHNPEAAQAHGRLVQIVCFADLLATCFMAGLEIERLDTERLQERLGGLGIRLNQLPLIVDQVPWQQLMYV